MSIFEETRALTAAERDMAWEVFWDTVPYKLIMIGNNLGLGDRAWMEEVDLPGLFTGSIYILHLGKIGFPDATSEAKIYGEEYEKQVRHTFIHEMTHVWQAENGGGWVFTRSVISRGCAWVTGDDAYEYDAENLKEWNEYNVEQQGRIVEHWFKDGKKQESDLYPYIRDHIRNC